MYYVYVLKSKRDGKLYVGYTKNLRHRLQLHGEGRIPSTKWRLPVILLYYEAHSTEEDARSKEKYLKTGWGRNYLKRTLKVTFTRLNEGKI